MTPPDRRRPSVPEEDEAYTFDTRAPREDAAPGPGTGSDERPRAARSMSSRGPEPRQRVSRPRPAPSPTAASSSTAAPARPVARESAASPRQRVPAAPGRTSSTVADPPLGRPTRRRLRLRRILAGLVALVLVWLAFMVWVPVNAWNNVEKVPLAGSVGVATGKNFLLVGSDSRDGLSAEDKERFGATDAEGKRTDTIILVHVPGGSEKPMMISLPRDSYVEIPGYGNNKINAAYAFGGPSLLAQTVEGATGLPVDGYLEIGFGGFANIVDSVGGVDICVKFDMNDPEAGIDLKAGCQTLDGADALGYVRSRKTDPRGDLGRADRQRELLSAVMKKALTPATVLIPWRYKGLADSVSDGITVGDDTSIADAVSIFRAMRSVSSGDGLSATVPIADINYATNAGVAVKWDTETAKEFFRMVREGESFTDVPQGAQN